MAHDFSERHGRCCSVTRPQGALQLYPAHMYPDAHISSLGLDGDAEARRLLRQALRDCWPAAKKFGWQVGALCELEPGEKEVGYSAEDGTLFVKVRDPARMRGCFYSYSFVLATLLHEMTHMSVLGHGKSFYRCLAEAATLAGADPALRREVRAHICGELLNAVCDNDSRRARALLAVLPEAVSCRLPGVGNQLPLEYAAHHGRVALTRLLLEARADPDITCREDGVPPLARAAARGNAKTAMVLLEAGALRGRDALDNSDPSFLRAAASTDPSSDRRPSAAAAKRKPRSKASGTRRSESLPSLPPAAAASVAATAAALEEMRRGAGTGRRPETPSWGKGPRRPVILSGSLAL